MIISGIFLEELKERRERNRRIRSEREERERRIQVEREEQERRIQAEREEQERRIQVEREEQERRIQAEREEIHAERDSLRTRIEQLEKWGERYQAAVAEGKQFDEPMPSRNGEK